MMMGGSVLNIISLGAGVQSSTMALMTAHGEIIPMPDCAIFADTQNEPMAVMRHLDALEKLLPFPVHRVTHGDLKKDFLDALAGLTPRCASPPFFTRPELPSDADIGGMLWRQCTQEYKLQPIRQKIRELSDDAVKQGDSGLVRQLIGISLDEAHRMRSSGVKYITNHYPLVDLRMTRGDCLAWMARNGYPAPPKSACFFCPYTSDDRWLDMKRNHPQEWARAIEFDDALRTRRVARLAAGIKGEIFIHRSMKPLRDAELGDTQTIDMFGNECEGLCGV